MTIKLSEDAYLAMQNLIANVWGMYKTRHNPATVIYKDAVDQQLLDIYLLED